MRKTTTIVFHGTSHDFRDEHFAVGQISYFSNPPGLVRVLGFREPNRRRIFH